MKGKRRHCWIAFVFLVGALAGGVAASRASDTGKGAGTAAIARVGGEEISREDLLLRLSESLLSSPSMTTRARELFPTMKENLLAQMIEDSLLWQEAARGGYDDRPAILAEVEKIRRESAGRLLLNRIREEAARFAENRDAELRKKLPPNEEEFLIRVLLLPDAEAFTSVDKDLKEGKNISEVVRIHSIGPSRDLGGTMGWARKSVLLDLDGFDPKALDLKPGEWTRPYETPAGATVYYLVERRMPSDAEYRREVEQRLAALKSDTAASWITERIKEHSSGLAPVFNARYFKTFQHPPRVPVKLVELPPEVVGIVGGTTLFREEYGRLIPDEKRDLQSPAGIENAIFEIGLSREALKRGLGEAPAVLRKMERRRREKAIETMLEETLFRRITLEEKDLQGYYNAFRNRFTSPAEYRIQYMNFKTEERAEEIRKIVTPENFEDVAIAHSEDYRKRKTNAAGWIPRTGLPAPLAAAIDKSGKGELTDTVRIKNEFFIVKVLDKKPSEVKAFKEVEDKVRALAMPEEKRHAKREHVGRLKSASAIRIDRDAVNQISWEDVENAKGPGGERGEME